MYFIALIAGQKYLLNVYTHHTTFNAKYLENTTFNINYKMNQNNIKYYNTRKIFDVLEMSVD